MPEEVNFNKAEFKFRELAARLKGGELANLGEFEQRVSQLAVLDLRGVVWQINPRTGKWMYYDGAEWVRGIPPGHDSSTVLSVAELDNRHHAKPASGTIPTPGVRCPPKAGPTSETPMNKSDGNRQPHGSPAWDAPPREAASYVVEEPRASVLAIHRRKTLDWIPLAVASTTLFICSITLLVGGRIVGATAVASPSATRTQIHAAVFTATLVAFPTETSTPALVRLPANVSETLVNLRAAPSTKARIIGKTRKNDEIILIGRNSDASWYRVTVGANSPPAWIFAETVDVQSGNVESLPIVP